MIPWKMIVSKYLKQLINGVIAGLLIGVSCVCYLVLSGMNLQVVGSLVFTIGFLFIALYGYEYFSAKIGLAVENKWGYLFDCFLALLGNFIGTWIIALITKMTSLPALELGLASVMAVRSGEGLVFDLFGKSILSGLIIYFVFNTYKKAEQPIARFSSLFLGAIVISLVGLNEVVSDMFYYNLGCLNGYGYGEFLPKLLYVIIGSSLGAMIVPLTRRLKALLGK